MRRVALILLLAALLLAACGGSSASHSAPANTTLVLDFTPNAVHAGIYEALAKGYDVKAGIRLHIVVPSASTDSIKLLETGRADFAILDIHDLAIARERGENIVGIIAIEQRPLASVLAAPRITNPRQLSGQTVGITGVPSDTAVLRSVVAGAGGNPNRVKTVTIGFNAVADLLAGRVAGATAFWNDEGVTVRRRAPGFHVFRVDNYGAPSYPELVVCATAASLKAHPARARALVRALTEGYRTVIGDPAAGERALEQRVSGLDPQLVKAELQGLVSSFEAPGGQVGALDENRLQTWARWELRFGIVKSLPRVADMFSWRYGAPH